MPYVTTIRVTATALLLLTGAALLNAQSVSISIPDTTAKRGDTLLVPIVFSALSTSDSVYSGQMDVGFSGGVIEIFGIESAGTLTAPPVSVNYNPTTRRLAFANANIITGSGVFVYLKVRARPQPDRDTTTIFPVNPVLNEGSPGVITDGGKFRILGIQISPKSPPSIIVVGDSLQFNVSGDQIPPLTFTLSTPAVGTVSSSGMFKALATGQTKIHVEDSRGLKDSTDLFPIYPVQASALTISVPDTSHTQTLFFNLPVRVSNVTGLDILSGQFVMTFSSTRLQATDVLLAGTLAEGWSRSFDITSGRIEVALAGTNALSGSGVLAYIRMKVLLSASGQTAINLSEAVFNENLTATGQSGQFTPLAAPAVVVSPGTSTLVIGETQMFSVTSGGTPPYQWSTSQSSVASIDPATGLLTALSRGSTTVSVTDSYGFVGTSGSVSIHDVEISLPDTGVWVADSVDVPILIDNVTGLGIYSFQLRVAYDSTVAKLLSVQTAGTIGASFTISVKDTLDTLRIAAAGTAPLSGGGALLKLRFASVAAPPGSGPLTLTQGFFNEPGISTPTARLTHGSIAVYQSAGVPTLVSPANGATEVALNQPLVWNSAGEATFYRLQVSTDPSFTPLLVDSFAVSDTSVIVAGLGVNTTYYWRVSGGNGGGYSAFSASRNFHTVLVTSVPVPGAGIPQSFDLGQNFPNPFNPTTTIRFSLPVESRVAITVFDVVGNLLGTLTAGVHYAGVHRLTFASGNLSSGVYFYKMEAIPVGGNTAPFTRTMKMVLVK